jgi:glyceraldehyde-3-phosphate dehydrogenase (NADP+)
MHQSERREAGNPVSGLTRDASQLVAALLPPGGALVNGAWRTANLTSRVHDPEDGTLIGFVAEVGPADVAVAVQAVAQSVAQDDWPLWARQAAMRRAAELLADSAPRFAGLIASEGVKTIREAEREVQRAVETMRLSAEAGDVLNGETIPFQATARGQDKIGWFTREPVGVIAALTSFNDPLNLVAHKVGPALVGGNGVVLKPSTHTPLTALALAEVLLEAGVPPRRISVIPGAAETGRALVTDPRVDLISFTGGVSTALKISAAAGPRKLLMELGGNNPTIVCADADLCTAVAEVVAGAFGVAGQNCLSVQRVYVHEACFNDFVDAAVQMTNKLVTGSKRDGATDVGPLITEAEARRVESWITEAVGQGAVLRTGGARNGAFVEPTILTDVKAGSRVLTDEIFGPVVSIMPFATMDDAVRAANDSPYALQAGIFTPSIDVAFRIAPQLVAGAVIINGTSDFRVDSMPFGGFKGSGIGREGVRFAVEAMTEPKNVIVNLTPMSPDAPRPSRGSQTTIYSGRQRQEERSR